MKTINNLKVLIGVVTALMIPLSSHAGTGAATHCDKVFQEVRASVEKEPQKVLAIVEDAMVANETCACEIVKAAIVGSKAGPELKKQIVLAATHVAPNMAPMIAQCAGAVSSGGKEVVEAVNQEIGLDNAKVAKTSGKGVVETIKEATPPGGIQPLPPEDGGSDYSKIPDDIRGIYLIPPATAVFPTPPVKKISKTSKKFVKKRIPPKNSQGQSDSVAKTS